MSKKVIISSDPFQPKISRNDRFAQMSHQEKVIEQKKKEIQAKLEAKQKSNAENSKNNTMSANSNKQPTKSPPKKSDTQKKPGVNIFNNDGSFLDTFKQLKDKRLESKLKSFKPNKDHSLNKNSRWGQRRRSPSPKEKQKSRPSRFSDSKPNFENNKITINTSFNNTQPPNYDNQVPTISPQNVTGQPLLKNILPPPGVVYPSTNQVLSQTNTSVIAAPPLLLNVPPPQIVQNPIILPNSNGNVLVSTPTVNLSTSNVLTTVTLPGPSIISSQTMSVTTPAIPVPPPCIPSVELSSIPPPNPIQVQNIPQPEPINTLNIPHPAPIQVQNIPTPNSIQLNEIPNPKPLDLLAIPTPDKPISDPNFIKNIPPPNKSIPPPNLTTETNVNVPPPNIPPPSTITIQSISLYQTIPSTSVPPPNLQQQPPNQQNFPTISVALPVGTTTNTIPPLMAQPILPPSGVNVNCPPPILPPPPSIQTSALPNFVNHPPPSTQINQMPPMNVPPPTTLGMINTSIPPFRDMNAGTPDYEAMASLGRMVAQCGPGIEDVVRQRKTQDPNLWFLFHKESAAYQQYSQLVEQFKRELATENKDKYEPDKPIEDDDQHIFQRTQDERDFERGTKRKRKSRWSDKEPSITTPVVVTAPVNATTGQVMISKITRTDPGLVQYAITTFGSSNLTEEEWKKAEDHYKINILYQDMVRKREELEKLQKAGKNKYEYDSDEDVEGGTWEHKLRDKEMMATQLWAQELTRQAEGKHHIGDFLPPEELKRFMEKTNANKEGRLPSFSDYKEFKIKEDNIGFKMLQKLGWSEGQGLGSNHKGIVEPINKAPLHENKQGLGSLEINEDEEDEYEAYRKRMMLAYRFRPNPLNNPRRPYY